MSYRRPELGPVKVGDELVRVSHRTGHHDTYRVVKVARKWATLVPRESPDTYAWPSKMDMVTGDEQGRSGFGSEARFHTQEQLVWEGRAKAAMEYLESAGFRTHSLALGQRWREDPVTLANLIRAHDGLDPL